MKKIKPLAFLLSGLLSVLAASANAGTLIPSEGSAITIDRDGKHIAVTAKTEVMNGDIITAHKGNAEVSYLNCSQTITEKHFVKVIEGKSCSAIHKVGNASKIAKIDPATANLQCKNCTAKLASKVATGKLFLVGGLAAAAAVIAYDNRDSSPN